MKRRFPSKEMNNAMRRWPGLVVPVLKKPHQWARIKRRAHKIERRSAREEIYEQLASGEEEET